MPNLSCSQSVSKGDVHPVHSQTSKADRFLRRQTVAERLGITTWTLTRMWDRGEGPMRRRLSPKFDGCLESDVQDYLKNLTAA